MPLKCSKRRRRRRISVVCLLSLSLSSEASRPAGTRVSYPISPLTLRGGAANNGGGGDSSAGDLDDEELDEYIDFLLAAADDKVTEADNPLFKTFRQLAEVEGNQSVKNDVLLTTSTTTTSLKPMDHVTVDTILESVEEESGSLLSDPSPAVVIEEVPNGFTPDSLVEVDNITLDTRTEPFEEDAGESLVSPNIDESQDDSLVTTSSPMNNGVDSATLETVTGAVEESDGESLHPSTMNDSVPVEEKVTNLDTTVWDVDDVDQLDDMINTLVAAVDEEHSSIGREDENLPETRLEDEPLQGEKFVDTALEINDNNDDEEDVQVLVDTETIDQIPETELVEPVLDSESTDPNDVVLESSIGTMILGEEEVVASTIETAAVEISIDEEPVDQETTVSDSSIEVIQDVAPINLEDQMEPTISLNANDEVSATTATSNVDSQDNRVSMIATDDDITSTSAIETNLEQGVEFFLGPSAVDESPQLTEDVIAESRHAAPIVIDSHDEIKEDDDDTPVVVDDVKTNKSDKLMSETKQTLHAARKSWGRWTGLLLGITTEKQSPKSSSRSYTPTWGQWTARLMGIETEKLAGSRSTSGSGAPKKDIDRIYNKYFLDYTPDPFTIPTGTETQHDSTDVGAPKSPDDEQPVRQEHVPSPLNGITRLWGKIDKALKQERSKPMAFLVDTAQIVSELDLDTNVTEGTPIDEEEKTLETTVVDSYEDDEEESVEVVADVTPEKVTVMTGTGDDATPSDEDMVQGKVDVSFTTEAKSGSDKQIGSVKVDETFVEVLPQEEELEYEEEEDEEENIARTSVEVDVEVANEPLSLEIEDDEDQDLNRETSNIDDAAIAGVVETTGALSSDTNEEVEEWELSAYDGMDGDEVDNSESDDSFTHPQVEDIDSARYSAFDEEGGNESMDNEEFEVQSDAQVMCEGVAVPLKEEVSDVLALVSAPNDLSKTRVASLLKDNIFARLRGGSVVDNTASPSPDDGGEGAARHVNRTGSLTDEDETADSPTVQVASSMISRPRPNALYRYLFTYGRLGHVLIMEIVLFHEWMETYLPFASTSIKWAVAQMFPRVFGQVESGDLPLSQTTGFVGADGSAVRGAKKRSSQMRKEDQRALDQLKKVGDVSQARYRFLSEGFMKRHGIGRFALREKLVARRASEIDDYSAAIREKGEALTVSEPESDAEWIVSALAQDEEDVMERMPSERKGFSQPTVTVGFEIGRGSRHKKKRSRISDPTWLTSEREKKQVGPRLSDRDSGVIGRIRAAGANSLVGRNILGAYPGDVPSPSDAADPRGLTEFAQRYGYGDWSDSEDDNLPDAMGRKMRSRLTDHEGDDGSNRKRKRRRKQVEINFGVGIHTKSSSTHVPRTRAKVNPRRTSELLDERKDKDVRGVGKAGIDAFERSATRKRMVTDLKKQNTSTEATAKLQAAKSQLETTGRSSVASKALGQLKDKAKRSDDSE